MKRLWWRTYWRIWRVFHKPRPAGIYFGDELVNGQIIIRMNGETRFFNADTNPYWRREK